MREVMEWQMSVPCGVTGSKEARLGRFVTVACRVTKENRIAFALL